MFFAASSVLLMFALRMGLIKTGQVDQVLHNIAIWALLLTWAELKVAQFQKNDKYAHGMISS
jgi:hypothetical protein